MNAWNLYATMATPEFFQYVDRAAIIGDLRPDKNLIFFVSENIHEGNLPPRLPDVVLNVDGVDYSPEVSEGPPIASHHRINYYSFPRRLQDGGLIELEQVEEVQLFVSNSWLEEGRDLSFVGIWEAPFELPEELKSRSEVTLLAMLALGAGLLSSVLTPCLLQTVVMYAAMIAGFTTVPEVSAEDPGSMQRILRRKVLLIAVAFVLGFILMYTLAGAVIGAVGFRAQMLFAENSRWIAIASGLFVIALGVWVGLRGRQPMICKVPDPSLVEKLSKRDAAGTILLSMAYALGCTACFGGAIVGTLIVYVGSIGSATIGAGVMATFAVGVAVPFLLAALFLSRAEPVLVFISSQARAINLATMVVIIVFGLILVTDNFHVVSDFIYPYLGLS